MFSDAGGVVARRRRDARLFLSFLSTLSIFWLLVFSLAPNTSIIHFLLLHHFDASEGPDGDIWCLPASHHRPSPQSPPQVSKFAEDEATASNCSYSPPPEFWLVGSLTLTGSETIPEYLRRNFTLFPVDELSSTPESSPLVSRGSRSSRLALLPLILVTPPQIPIFFSLPHSRRTLFTIHLSGKRLGLRLLGMSHSGPQNSSSWPISTNYDPTAKPNWTRSVSFISLLSPLTLRYRRTVLTGRRHLSNFVSTSSLWLCDFLFQTLVQSNPQIPSPERICFKASLVCDNYSRRDMMEILYSSEEFSLKKLYTDCKFSPKEFNHQISLTAGVNPGPLLVSCLVMLSRTHGIFILEKLYCFENFCRFGSRLVPRELYSTSQYLLIRTIYQFLEQIAKVVSIRLGLACDLLLHCSRLRVPLELSNCLSFFYFLISFFATFFFIIFD